MARNENNPSTGRAADSLGLRPVMSALVSVDQHNSILENLKEVVFQTDAEGRWLFLNHAWEEILGHSVQDSLGKVFLEYVHPDDRQRNQELFEPLIRRDKAYCRHEIRYLTRDGGSRWVEVFARLGLDKNDEVIGTFGTLTDITERKEAESVLKISEEQFKLIAENTSDGIVVFDAEGHVRYESPAYLRQLGYDENESAHTPEAIYVLLHEDDRDALFANIYQAIATKQSELTYQYRASHKQGHYIWREDNAKFIYDDTGTHVATYVVSRDITDRKQAEDTLRREYEKNLALLRYSSDGIHILSDEAKLIEVSDSFCEMLGYTREEMLGMHLAEWDVYFNQEELRQAFQHHFNSPARFQFESRHRRKDGTVIDVEISGYPMLLDGKSALFASSRDITERKRYQQQLETNKEILDISHDGFWLMDGNGKLLMANQAFAHITGYSMAELIGMQLGQLEAKEQTIAEIKAHMAKIIAHGSDTFETVHRHKDGHLIDIEITTNYIKESNQFAVFARDISARKRAEIELRIASTAFESLEGIMITDANGIILRVNQAFIETTGYLAEEVIGKTPRILKSGYHDEDFYSEMWKRIGEDGRWEGEIWDRRKNGEVYPKWLAIKAIKHSDGTVINYVSTQIDISARKSAEEAVKHLAYFDPLTELPNRRLLLDRVHQAFACSNRTGKCGALLFIDLDNFKSLNDTLGHAVGDLLLQEVAKRLTASVREGDTVARLGGDEFVVVLEGLSEQALEAATQAEWVGLKILASLKRTYLLGNYEHRCSGSVGATLFQDHQQSFDELLRQADISMYQAKKAGRNALRFFAPEMQNSINLTFALEKELHDAVDGNQFELHYQIQVDGSYRPVGVECLVRWMHPARGLVAPNLFIPLAEESGIILSLGAWVLETACAQLKAWQQDELTRHLVLAVNVSAKQFHQKQFAQQVIELVTSYAINPKLLKLELTESMLVDDVESTIVAMSALRDIGIQFSLDDFGTGYSSLQYLKRLPLDQLKIDMSFVRNIETDYSDRTIVRTIVSMAQSLSLDVIAEGVESEEQRQILLNTGCSHLQGYLFSKPLPLGDFELLLKMLHEKQTRHSDVRYLHLDSD